VNFLVPHGMPFSHCPHSWECYAYAMLASLPRYHFGLECMAKQGNMCLLASGTGAKDIAGQLQTQYYNMELSKTTRSPTAGGGCFSHM